MNLFQFDDSFRSKGHAVIAGVDEAGRGPWAGPVVAAAVILPEKTTIVGLNDSKKLTPRQREKIFEEINAVALGIGIGIISHAVIDSLNILKATHAAMHRALSKIRLPIDLVLIDGLPVPSITYPQEAIVKGDAQSASIAAASVIAKVTRDRIMLHIAAKYPHYGFEKHKGYGTKLHYQELVKHGPSPVHRKTFCPVKDLLEPRVRLADA